MYPTVTKHKVTPNNGVTSLKLRQEISLPNHN